MGIIKGIVKATGVAIVGSFSIWALDKCLKWSKNSIEGIIDTISSCGNKENETEKKGES